MTNDQQPIKVPFIKKSAVITIALGTSIIGDLQSTLVHLLDGRTEEELTTIRTKLDSNIPLVGWEVGVITLSRLLQEIQGIAEQSGDVEMRDLTDALSSLS